MLSHLAVSALVALVASSTLSTTNAFAPPTITSSRLNGGLAPVAKSRSSIAASSLQEEKTLTDTDEDILFGGSSIEYKGRNRVKTKTGAILPDNGNRPNPLDHSKDPLVIKLRTMRDTVTSCPANWKELANNCPDKRALLDEHYCDEKIDLTFREMEDKVRRSGAAFKNLGVKRGMNVAVLGENSAMWLIVVRSTILCQPALLLVLSIVSLLLLFAAMELIDLSFFPFVLGNIGPWDSTRRRGLGCPRC